jgi:hypothetical protein
VRGTTRERVERFLEDRDNGIWFQVLCEQGWQAVEAQAWQVAKSLRRNKDEARDAMLELAHELLPDSPAGAEDPRQVLFREMGVWASRQPEGVQDRLRHGLTDDGFQEAWDSGLHGLRGYLRTACEAAMAKPEAA